MSVKLSLFRIEHEGHQGIVRTKQRLREMYGWPNMDTSGVAFTASVATKQVTAFLTSVFSKHGNPTTLVSDKGALVHIP